MCKCDFPACEGRDCWHPLALSIFCMHSYGSLCFAKPSKMGNLKFKRLQCFLKGKSQLCGLQYLKFKFSSCSGQGNLPAKASQLYRGINQKITNAVEVSAFERPNKSAAILNCSETVQKLILLGIFLVNC